MEELCIYCQPRAEYRDGSENSIADRKGCVARIGTTCKEWPGQVLTSRLLEYKREQRARWEGVALYLV